MSAYKDISNCINLYNYYKKQFAMAEGIVSIESIEWYKKHLKSLQNKIIKLFKETTFNENQIMLLKERIDFII